MFLYHCSFRFFFKNHITWRFCSFSKTILCVVSALMNFGLTFDFNELSYFIQQKIHTNISSLSFFTTRLYSNNSELYGFYSILKKHYRMVTRRKLYFALLFEAITFVACLMFGWHMSVRVNFVLLLLYMRIKSKYIKIEHFLVP